MRASPGVKPSLKNRLKVIIKTKNMFKNYLISALRFLQRNRFFAGINILGLSLSLAASALVKWVAIAFVIATPIAYYAMQKWLENFAYKTNLSWWIFALAGLIALGIALLTVSFQSWKAATKNPVESLRYE